MSKSPSADELFRVGVQHHQSGRLQQAESVYRQVLAATPQHAGALHYLGVIAHQIGKHDAAIDLIRQAIALRPNFPEALSNLASALWATQQLDDAISACRQAILLDPNAQAAYSNLGNALCAKGQLDEAIAASRRAIALNPKLPAAYNNLGNALRGKGQLDDAVAAYRQALTLNPRAADVHSNLGNALRGMGRPEDAIAAYRQSIALNPRYALAHNNLGNALKDNGQLTEAIYSWRQAIALKPDFSEAHSNLVYGLHFHPDYDAAAIHKENRNWDRQHAAPLRKTLQDHDNDRTPDRRLRIGYVSPDFRDHAESFFTVPLLANHDHVAVEIYCYSSVTSPDRVTEQLMQHADVWRDVRGANNEQLAQIVREDRIDILVDLTMHMANNRALMFARKPAPVQVCWLAYPGSTGMDVMDYRITDSFMDPPDADTSIYSEHSVRLQDCWVVYDPLTNLPPRPAEQTGPITFGSMNNPGKLNDSLLTLWSRVLKAAEGSRLLLRVVSHEYRARIMQRMQSLGIDQDRLTFVGKTDRAQYLRAYDQVDIALDPLPYNGITTTCDALYMGTPVLTLVGQTAAGRAGLAMLSTLGLQELIAKTSDEFVRKATDLAQDRARLTALRASLRQKLQQSPLMDVGRFARGMESAYRLMWSRYCTNAIDETPVRESKS